MTHVSSYQLIIPVRMSALNMLSDCAYVPATYSVPDGIVARDPCSMPLTVRISMLNLRFMKLLKKNIKSQVEELQSFYFLKCGELESDRFSSLTSASNNQYMQYSVNVYCDHQHHSLISRVEESLQLIEQHVLAKRKEKKPEVDAPEINDSAPVVSKTTVTNSVAIRIMTNWYERNSEHPYPSYETAEVMAKAGGITVEQVKKWFANRRLRLGHTKHITQIAKRRKRSRTVSKDDILLTGCSVSE